MNNKQDLQKKQDQITVLKSHCRLALQHFLNGQLNNAKSQIMEISKLKQEQRKGTLNIDQTKSYHHKHFDFEQNEQKEKLKKIIKPRITSQRNSKYCIYCPQNQQLKLLSASNFVYLSMPKNKTFKKYHHYIIAPVDHIQTRIGADRDVGEELRNYQKCLIQMLDKANIHTIFIEQFSQNNSHIYIQCIGIPLKKAYDLPFFFKQALENVQGYWTTHKNIIQIRKQKGGLQKQIPKQIKYFYIDFGLGYGYAHTIQNQKYWDRKFCYQIIASALGIETFQVKSTEQYDTTQLQIKQKQFKKMWEPFDWTRLIEDQEKN